MTNEQIQKKIDALEIDIEKQEYLVANSKNDGIVTRATTKIERSTLEVEFWTAKLDA